MLVKQTFPQSYVVASDVAVAALFKAKEVASMANILADRYVACDVHHLPFPDNSFDICFGSEILHHLDDPIEGLKEIRRVLRPEGKYIGMGEGHAAMPLRWLLKRLGLDRESIETQNYRMREELYSIGQWKQFFEKAGFSQFKFTMNKDISYQYRSRMRLIYYLLLGFLPNCLIRTVLGSAMTIYATK